MKGSLQRDSGPQSHCDNASRALVDIVAAIRAARYLNLRCQTSLLLHAAPRRRRKCGGHDVTGPTVGPASECLEKVAYSLLLIYQTPRTARQLGSRTILQSGQYRDWFSGLVHVKSTRFSW